MVDEQLGAAVEEIGERPRAVLGLEPVVLLDRDPGQLAALLLDLVVALGLFGLDKLRNIDRTVRNLDTAFSQLTADV